MIHKIRILLVEDEILTAMYMKAVLEKSGFQIIDNVATGEKAVTSFVENKPDIILMDIMLAGQINGIEAAHMINDIEGRSVPVIFCTAYGDRDIREKAEEVKPVDFLIKPLDMMKLTSLIENWFISN